MNLRRSVLCAVALLSLLVGSSCKGDEPTPPPISTAPAQPTEAPKAADLKVDGPAVKPGIEPRVKAEVDGRSDGVAGAALAVTGSRASLQVPATWKSTKGGVTVVVAADEKAHLGVSSLGTEGAAAKLPAVATALGLASCEWGGTEALIVGSTKLGGTGADGVCMRGTTQVRTAYVATPAEGLLVVGAWTPDGDSAGVFGAMRSITRPGGTGGGDAGIGPCCAALRQNAKSAPPDQQGLLLSAAAVCDAVKNSPQGRAALSQVRAALAGAKMPANCL